MDSQPSAIQLKLAIAGLGREGCDVEVKPGNASCRFRVLNVTEQGEVFKKGAEGPQHVSSNGYAYMELRDIQLRGADKICTVAITVREPGQTTRTVYRGFPLKPKAEPGKGAIGASREAARLYLLPELTIKDCPARRADHPEVSRTTRLLQAKGFQLVVAAPGPSRPGRSCPRRCT